MTKYELDFEAIEKFALDKKGKYRNERRDITYLLPLPTREPERAKFERGFWSITAGITRLIFDKDIVPQSNEETFEALLQSGKFDSDATMKLFKYYLQEQSNDVQRHQVSQLFQIENIPLSESKAEQKGEIDYIKFLFDSLISGSSKELTSCFKNENELDLLNNIIISLNQELVSSKEYTPIYPTLFKEIKNQFLEDLKLLSKNSVFMLENINTLLVHYLFILMSQTVLQTNKLTDFNENKLVPLFFIMNWENGASWRNNYKEGFKLLREQVNDFYSHEHALNIIGKTTFTTERNLYYHNIHQKLQQVGPEAERQYIESVYKWLNEVFADKTGIEVEQYSETKQLNDAFSDLVKAVSANLGNELKSRYPKAFEAIILKFYRKHGGSLGTLLSLSQEQLILLVAVSIKQERIELNLLWKEFEKRGIWMDYQTKEEVIKTLDKLNYLEKKSDSGDAQYVKSIL